MNCRLSIAWVVFGVFLISWAGSGGVAYAQSASQDDLSAKSFTFDGSISREVLENYLDRSVTMTYLLVTGKAEGKYEHIFRDDDIRLIKNVRPKFIGRAIYRWNGEDRLNDPTFWEDAKRIADGIHDFDYEIILQGCLFETISTAVNAISVPAWCFQELGMPVETRNFSYEEMLNKKGKLARHWGRAAVPDISRDETKLWFVYLAGSYIDVGCEALHLGQVGLIGMNDPSLKHWKEIIGKIRSYAARRARRHAVLLDAHVPEGGLIVDGVSLLDFNSFPLRIKERVDHPLKGKLEIGFLDSLYQRSKGCVSPSGWSCNSLPYLVEFDNFGRARESERDSTHDIFAWGYDEISWFAIQDENYRNEWLAYARNWLKENDPNGHLQMPVCRMITCENTSQGYYRANNKSDSCPIGYSQEDMIKSIFLEVAK
jgi:hypothetical protein